MASGLLGSGISGLLATQRALSVTSQNIANVNTEGYNRQRVEFSARAPQPFGNSFVGTGTFVSKIERVYDQFVTQKIQTSRSGFNQAQAFNGLASQVDNLLGDPQAGLTPPLQDFFKAVHDVANDPASIPARQVLISSAQSLQDRFSALGERLGSLQASTNDGIRQAVDEVNSLTSAIAGVNKDISFARTTGSGEPNDLLDQRDRLIDKLSEYVKVSTVAQDDGSLNVFIGNGQVVVAGNQSRSLSAVQNGFDAQRIEVGYVNDSGTINISAQLSGGKIGGLVGFRNQVLDPSQNALGQLAVGLTSTFNAQHRQGIDLNGKAGGDFFVPIDSQTSPPSGQVFPNQNSQGLPPGQVSVLVSDASLLGASDYRLERNGAVYTLTRLSDQTTTVLKNFPGSPDGVDGLQLTLNAGAIADGDSFLVRPLQNASRDFALAISDPALIAAASPLKTEVSLANSGSASIDGGAVVDSAAYTPDNYSLYGVNATSALADGLSSGAISDSIGTDNALQYQLVINGTVVYKQNEGAPQLADLPALAAVINDDVATTGVRAYVDTASNQLYLANEPAAPRNITVTEKLLDTNGSPLPLDVADSANGYFGASLDGANPEQTLNFSSSANAYVALDSSGNILASGSYNSAGQIAFKGLQVSIAGQLNSGDSFTIQPNVNGAGDNRNALQLAQLQTRLSLAGGSSNFEEIYSRLVADVGTKTRQSEVSSTAQQGLLDQAVQVRESKSGVNLDEEAANMLRYQQAYTAAARIIATADSLFQTLISVVRR